MSPTVLLRQFHYQALVIRQRELIHRPHRALVAVARHVQHEVLCAQGLDDLLLNGGSLCHLLIHNLPCNEVHVEGHVAGVLNLRVEVQQTVMRIDAFQEELDAK